MNAFPGSVPASVAVTVTLQDRSRRTFDHPVSVLEVAQSIGPGLAKNTVAGKIDGQLVDEPRGRVVRGRAPGGADQRAGDVQPLPGAGQPDVGAVGQDKRNILQHSAQGRSGREGLARSRQSGVVGRRRADV